MRTPWRALRLTVERIWPRTRCLDLSSWSNSCPRRPLEKCCDESCELKRNDWIVAKANCSFGHGSWWKEPAHHPLHRPTTQHLVRDYCDQREYAVEIALRRSSWRLLRVREVAARTRLQSETVARHSSNTYWGCP